MTPSNKRKRDLSRASSGMDNRISSHDWADDFIDHLVFASNPNGEIDETGHWGEVRYWKDDKDIPAAQAIKQLLIKARLDEAELCNRTVQQILAKWLFDKDYPGGRDKITHSQIEIDNFIKDHIKELEKELGDE